jgi:hypothetical protein
LFKGKLKEYEKRRKGRRRGDPAIRRERGIRHCHTLVRVRAE